MSELPLASKEFKTVFDSKCLLISYWKKNKTYCYALKWIVYMATEGFGHLQYDIEFKLENSCHEGRDMKQFPWPLIWSTCIRQAEGSLDVPAYPWETGKARLFPLPAAVSSVGLCSSTHLCPMPAHGYILLKALLLLKTTGLTIGKEQK